MVTVWCEFVCCICADTAAGRHVTKQHIPRQEMKTEAIWEHGWVFVRSSLNGNEKAYCKTCAEGKGYGRS